MKSILVIGAGKFGTHLALDLYKLGNEVMLVDRDETKINEVSHLVTAAEIGDYAVKSNLEALGISDFDNIFVCTSDFKSSLVIIDYLKELGVTVFYFPYGDGVSSTKIKEEILENYNDMKSKHETKVNPDVVVKN